MENNPYAAPRAPVIDVAAEKSSRPVLVWIITIFMAFGTIGGMVSSLLALSGNPIGGEAAASYMKSMGVGALDHLYLVIVMAVSAFGYIDLFRLKKRALLIIGGLFVVGMVVAAIKFAVQPAYRAMLATPQGYWSLLGGWAFSLAIIGYVWWLRRKGVLR